MSDYKDNNLEQLSKELIEVFNFDNLDKSTSSQKEKMIQKVIRLGGDNYTAEDLRRDILKIQMEDNTTTRSINTRSKIKGNQGTDRTATRDLKEIVNCDLNKDNLRNKVSRELEMEEFGNIGECTSAQETEIQQQEFGICMNQEGLVSPVYGKSKGKRGRRSLKELRESEGLANEQRKIDELLNTGRGKSLPEAT